MAHLDTIAPAPPRPFEPPPGWENWYRYARVAASVFAESETCWHASGLDQASYRYKERYWIYRDGRARVVVTSRPSKAERTLQRCLDGAFEHATPQPDATAAHLVVLSFPAMTDPF